VDQFPEGVGQGGFVAGLTDNDDIDAAPALGGGGHERLHLRVVAHVADHRTLFDRVALELPAGPIEEVSTDRRIARGGADPGLVELLFQYGRYLLIASSRPGTQPANLQGVWNEDVRAPWSANYTININTQMNYWPAETTALPELHEPLITMVEQLSVNGTKTAC